MNPPGRTRLLRLVLVAALALGSFLAPRAACSFGKNKLRTQSWTWRCFETEHFEIFFYPEEEALAREVCADAEEAFDADTRLLRYRPQDKTPLFIYRNQVDFQQTNISPSVIGVGTAGFTEAFKNRIALPAPASPNLLRQVIRHEFMHALQFDIIYGEGMRSFRVYKGYLMPLWLIEGMAEYATRHWDAAEDMIIRDAVVNDRLQPLTLLEGFDHLEDVYLAYKESQLAIIYLAEKYGEEKLAAIFKRLKSQIALSPILRETLGVGLTEFNHDFLVWARQKYWVQANGRKPPADYGSPLWDNPAQRLSNLSGPAWSPDGRYLAYVSDQDQTPRVYVRDRRAWDQPQALTSRKFEYFSYRGRPLAWSPDGRRIAFVAREEGQTRLYAVTRETLDLESMVLPCDDFYSPAWSPDGAGLAVIGVSNGTSDIFLWESAQKKFTRLTQDRWADDSPAWSSDGHWLIYSSERGDTWQLYMLDPRNGTAPAPVLNAAANCLQPQFSGDGRCLYFTSDRDGVYNIYRLEWTAGTYSQLTNIQTGVFQPAVSADGQKVAFTAYEKGSQNLYVAGPESQYPEVAFAAATTPVAEAAAASPVAAALAAKPYQFRFSPDLLFLLAGYDSSQGLVGGGYLTASDYLGDHLVSLASDFVPGYQSQTTLTYGNFSFPVDLFFQGSYRRNYYRLLDLETGTLLDEFNDQETSGGLQLNKPFSLYDRIELGCNYRYLRREHQEDVINQRIASLVVSLVHDSTDWYDYEPSEGFRHQLSLTHADRLLGGETNYSLWQLNSQAYFSLDALSPYMVFGARLLAGASIGPDHPLLIFAGIGVLPESGTIRGYRYGDLLGSQVAALNLELRFPLARNINYSLWPLDFLLLKNLQMVVFDDLGTVTNNFLEVEAGQIKNSVGLGFRLHTFLLGKELLTIRFDISKITQTAADPYYTWGLGQAF